MKRFLILCFLCFLLIFGFASQVSALSKYSLVFEWDKIRDGRNAMKDEHPSDTGDASAVGFSFTTGASNYTLGYVQYWLSKTASPTADIVAVLYDASGNIPTGNPIIYSDNLVDSSTLTPHTTYAWVTFNFTDSDYSLNANANYSLTVEINTTGVDGSNYVNFGTTSTNSSNYSRFRYVNGAWNLEGINYDCIFRVYSVTEGDPPQITYGGFNSTLNGSISQFTYNFTDNIGLSHFVHGWNNSGTWVNTTYSLSGTENQTLLTFTLNASDGVKIEYRVWVNDTSNNWNQIPLFFFYTNTEPIIIVSVGEGFLIMGVFFLCGVFGLICYVAYSKH